MSALAVRFHRGGVYLPRLGLWLDPHEPQTGADRVFISHAHSNHTGVHREVILSGPTAKLMRSRLAGEWIEHVLPFGQATEFKTTGDDSFKVTLLPAGHIFGSAMSFIEAEGQSLLYTGDFKLRRGLSAEPCDPGRAKGSDVLIMETTYGRPAYQFPPSDDIMQGVIRFCREALENEETPALLGYSLGKSQELLCGLGGAGLPIMLHGAVFKLTEIYKQFGQCFPPFERFDAETARGKVLICPPNVANSAMLRKIGKVRTALLTGWAMDPNCRYRYQVDAAFPLSDHADFHDLVELVNLVAPKKVFTLHGFAADFAQTLRDLGVDAQALSEEEQLALPLALGVHGSKFKVQSNDVSVVSGQWSRGRGQESGVRKNERMSATTEAGQQTTAHEPHAEDHVRFITFANTCAQIRSTSRKLEKTRWLADYLKGLASVELGIVTPWFTGNPFPATQNKVLQLGWAVIRDALCAVGELDQAGFGQVYLKHSDLGETAFEILQRSAPDQPTLTVHAVQAAFEQLHAARGPIAKLPILVRTLRAATGLEGKYLLKILTGDLRIGLKEGLVEEAIAKSFEVPLTEVKNTNLLLGNIGETAVLAAERNLASAALIPFRPVKFMLASPEETAADIWARVTRWNASATTKAIAQDQMLWPPTELKTVLESAPMAWIEDKYDGIRCQLHKVGPRVGLYSRDLKEITATFLDLTDLIQTAPDDFVFDGEIVAMRAGAVLPFADLQRRLGRRESDLFLRDEIPVQFIAFDLLWLNGEDTLSQPLALRREKLEKVLPSAFGIAQTLRVHSVNQIETAFAAARERGNEGLMIKDPASSYTPGRRGLAWLKLKKAYASLDCVVVGAEYGHGKRKDVLSDYTFAVRDETNGELKAIGKAYTGLTDAEIAQLTSHFLSKVVWQRGRYHAVEPDTVLEIAFDRIQQSNRHSSGLAMRFPRIVRIRADKSVGEIDTLATAKSLLKP
ncbi:MAG: ATP-dependent DNA ligase [Verrucomicrobiales bacterium]|nr:ATP-dependent DNA ligase [Verrucomicrobiales bacterium]